MDGATLRQAVLEAISVRSQLDASRSFSSKYTLTQVVEKLFPPPKRPTLEQEQAILTFRHDLLVGGFMAFGSDVVNCVTDRCHLTDRGRAALKHLSRDPLNPDGYLEHLRQRSKPSAVALSYIQEALKTFGAGCWKATAVMVGAAAERLTLDVRDAIVNRMASLSKTPPPALTDWKIKAISRGINDELAPCAKAMPHRLAEAFAANWPVMAHQIRVARNDAGRPTDTEPVSPDTVHASMLMFPELAATATDLIDWVGASYN